MTSPIVPLDVGARLRTSAMVLGPMLARMGTAMIPNPGGCRIGARPIDQHLKGLQAMGAEVKLDHGYVDVECKRLRGATIVLDMPTVTGCENLMMAAARIPGRTSWEWDEATKTQYRRVNAYLSDSRAMIDMHPSLSRDGGAARGKQTVSFHRPLQVYVKALAKHGFAIVKLEEWISHKKSEPGPRAKEEDRSRKEIPLFLYLEARWMA